jgi:hypothetical protein
MFHKAKEEFGANAGSQAADRAVGAAVRRINS